MVRTPRNIPLPTSLKLNAAKWTARYKSIHGGSARGDWATINAKRLLRDALRELAHGKCVFCERTLEVGGFLEVEHYHPKTVHPHLAFDWENLLPACGPCNVAKRNENHGGVLLKPDHEDPEPYFWIHPDSGRLEPHPKLDNAGRLRAEESIRICNLQRPKLCTKRAQMLSRMGRWLLLVAEHGVNDPLREEWEFLSHPATEYKLAIRHMLDRQGLQHLSARDRIRFEARQV